MEERNVDRRQFLGRATGAAGLVATAPSLLWAAPASPRKLTDRVELGKTGIKLSMLGIGTGTVSGSHQRALGMDGFSRLMHYAYDHGINYFDCADSYKTHPFLKPVFDELPRDKIIIQSKTGARDAKKAQADIERFLKELDVDYIDMVLCHCARTADWEKEREGTMEVLSKAKEKGWIRAHGVSVHGMEPLRATVDCKWIDHGLFRLNHVGTEAQMDGTPDEVSPLIQKIRENGKGILAMKITGEGKLKGVEIDKSLQYVLSKPFVQAMVIGFEKPEEIDDILKRSEAIFKQIDRAAA
jgi:predicted aldo/keto reductase-like oxidoreductase